MFSLFKSLEEREACQSVGMCTTDLRLTSLEELLQNELRQIAFCIVKIREYGRENAQLMSKAIAALSVSLLNINFNEKDYRSLYNEIFEDKKLAYEMYNEISQTEMFANMDPGKPIKGSIADMIREGEAIANSRQKAIGQEKRGLFLLIGILVKVASRNIQRIKSFESDYCEYDFEILRLLSLTNSPSVRKEKLVRRIKEFLVISDKIISKSTEVLMSRYGEAQSTDVRTSAKKGKAILMDGLDLYELERLLDAIGDRPINVYTHGITFVAHYFPKLHNHKNLAGHWGASSPEYDFSNFPGAIFLGSSYFQKIDTLCRGMIYSSARVGIKGVAKIVNDNFEPLIRSAQNLPGFSKDSEETSEYLEHNPEEFTKMLESSNAKKITVLVGQSTGEHGMEMFGDSQLVHINTYLDLPLLELVAHHAKERSLKMRFIFAQCSSQVINVALNLKHKFEDTQIYISKCPTLTINPTVAKALEEDLDLHIL